MALSSGQKISGNYVLIRKLGAGGFGEVWLADSESLKRHVALKFLHPVRDENAERRFMVEARVLARLDVPGCLALLDFDRTSSGQRFLVTEFVDGLELQDWLQTGPSLASKLDVARQLCVTVHGAHEAQVLHRDLKPSNVMVRISDGAPRVVVLDFGIAKISGLNETDITKTGDVFGTPGFMSPEQLRGQRNLGSAVDIYALGAILYEMFDGRPPFVGVTAIEVAMMHLTQTPAIPAHAPAELQPVIMAMLQKAPERRPALSAVRAALGEDSALRPRRHAKRGNSSVVLAVAAVAGLVIAASVFFWGNHTEEAVRSRTAHRNVSSLVKQPVDAGVPEVVATPRPDAGHDAGLKPVWPPLRTANFDPCRLEPPVGVLELGSLKIYAPTTSAIGERRGSLLVLHDGLGWGAEIVLSGRLQALANKLQLVIFAPNDHGTIKYKPWRAGGVRKALEDVEEARGNFCLDSDRRFALGIGLGGKFFHAAPAADLLPYSAVVISGHDPTYLRDDPLAVPLMVLNTDGCTLENDGPSRATQDAHYLLTRSCGAGTEPFFSDALGSCVRTACEPSLVTCDVQGGPNWPELDSPSPHYLRVLEGCPPGSDFDYTGAIARFLAEQSAESFAEGEP